MKEHASARKTDSSPSGSAVGASLMPPACGIGFLDRAKPPLQPKARAAQAGPPPVQRVVKVGSETASNEAEGKELWVNVRSLVDKVYKRKQTLLNWAESKDSFPAFGSFTDYEALANALDAANQKDAGRKRPDFTEGIKAKFNKTWGGKRHRRHIIMSSLMRDAVYAVTDNVENDRDETLQVYNEIIKEAGGKQRDTLQAAEAELVFVLHNNPANLVLDMGAENSAIGSLAHNALAHLQGDMALHFRQYKANKTKYFQSLVGGFQPEVQAGIMRTVDKRFWRVTTLATFRALLEFIYDNTAFDLMTYEKMPSSVAELVPLHGRFLAVQSSGDLDRLRGTAITYVRIGHRSEVKYKDVWGDTAEDASATEVKVDTPAEMEVKADTPAEKEKGSKRQREVSAFGTSRPDVADRNPAFLGRRKTSDAPVFRGPGEPDTKP